MKQKCVMFCKAKHLVLCESVIEAEITEIVLGLKLVNQNKCISVVLHSDSTEAIWAFQSGSVEASKIMRVLKESLELLKDNPERSLCLALRENNTFSDFMAKRARIHKWN